MAIGGDLEPRLDRIRDINPFIRSVSPDSVPPPPSRSPLNPHSLYFPPPLRQERLKPSRLRQNTFYSRTPRLTTHSTPTLYQYPPALL